MTWQIPPTGRGHCMFNGGSHYYGAKHAAFPAAAGVKWLWHLVSIL